MIVSVLVVPGFEETVPFPDEIAAFASAQNGDPDYQPDFTQQEILQILALTEKWRIKNDSYDIS